MEIHTSSCWAQEGIIPPLSMMVGPFAPNVSVCVCCESQRFSFALDLKSEFKKGLKMF
jgi:hypothetical protein